MPKRDLYERFLPTAREQRTACVKFQLLLTIITDIRNQKAPCNNKFKAVEQVMMYSKACDVMGIVAVACALLLPQQYSQPLSWRTQKNVDYSLLQALKTTNVDPDDQEIVFAYDVVCTHCVHFIYRIGHLLPPGAKFDFAIGLFHVHGHKDECFFRYSPAFIPETGAFAGEILESLWARMNTITPSARTATLAHRAELDGDHANDSNYHKLLGMGM